MAQARRRLPAAMVARRGWPRTLHRSLRRTSVFHRLDKKTCSALPGRPGEKGRRTLLHSCGRSQWPEDIFKRFLAQGKIFQHGGHAGVEVVGSGRYRWIAYRGENGERAGFQFSKQMGIIVSSVIGFLGARSLWHLPANRLRKQGSASRDGLPRVITWGFKGETPCGLGAVPASTTHFSKTARSGAPEG